MDITKYNFEEELENIKKVIDESDFLAIDGEFTGLSLESVARICPFDTPAERYKKQRDGASDFLLVQFGLCAFKAVEGQKRYEARPFNFYIFPRPHNHQSPDRRFLCQTSSIDFLVSHNFDFNKLFKEGIPYFSQQQEVRLREELEQRLADQADSLNSIYSPDATPGAKKPFVVPKEHEEYITQIRERIDAYISSEETEPLAFPPCNTFQRKLIYQSIKPDYPLITIETKTGEKKERFVVVTRCGNRQEMELKQKVKQNLERMKLDIQVGFSKVMQAITQSGKLVVGHNMYLDVIHSVNHFYSPAPQELEDFKEMISAIFPRLLDTKLMASTSPFKEYFYGTSLEELMKSVKLPPFKPAQVDLPEGFDRYSHDSGAFHEAGYDAFVTGSCFASMVNFLGRYQNPPSSFLSSSNKAIQPFVNKLFMMRVTDIPYVNLAGPDDMPSREHVFHITFPLEWRVDDLHQLFEPYGNVQISWLSRTTAFVGLMKKENAKLAAASLCQGMGPYHVTSYHAHKMALQAKSTPTTTTTPTTTSGVATNSSSRTRPDPRGTKRRSPPTDGVAYPPSKVRRSTLTYPSIPEEDELAEEDKEEKKVNEMEVEEREEEEDLGIPLTEDMKRETPKSKKKSPSSGEVSLGNNRKLFDEPDAW